MMITDAQLSAMPTVYAALQDDESRAVYRHRLLYALTGDESELMSLVASRLPDERVKTCLYGAGEVGHWLLRAGCRTPFVIDKYQRGSVEGCPVISLDDFLRMPDCREYHILLTVVRVPACDEIAAELTRLGLHFQSPKFGVQYFDVPQMNLHDEYFVDAGALDGADTAYLFSRRLAAHAYVFEPGPQQMAITRERLANYATVDFHQCGLADTETTLRFETRRYGRSGAKLSDSGDIEVPLRRLDNIIYGGGVYHKVTFVKMDIEGAESAALHGAERTLREQHPKLAISVYHKPEDIWVLPSQILQCYPSYKFYLRHYSLSPHETVLYALP